MLNPDFPFSYDHYLAHPDGLGSVPPELYGTEVAVVGAGLSGLVTAYELMKLGLRPVVYEADRIGGRLRTASFPSAPGIVADLGGMRFPVSGKAFYHYVDLLGLQTQAFPNPLAPATSSTVIELAGQKYYAETAADLPPFFREVADAWKAAVNDGAGFAEMQDAIRARDTARIKELWNALLPQLDEQTFYGFIAGSDSFKEAGFAHREAFGQVGFGTGGWDTDFPNSILEILRVVYTDADDQHRLIVGGAQRLPEALWEHAPSGMAHWPDGTSLASLHAGAPRGAVDRIARDGGGDFRIRERWGRESAYPAVVTTCQSWLLSTRIHTDEALFPAELWTAIERSHYMQSSKTFVMVDRPFWKDIDPATGREVLSMTLTDRLNRATYLLDNGPDQPAVILLSYTWNDDALKWLPLDRGGAGGAHAALAGADLPRRRHRQPHRRPADHRLLGGRPQLHGRLQGQPAGALPLPAAAVHALQAGRAAGRTARDLPRRRRRLLHRRLGRGRRHHRPERGLGRGEPPRRPDPGREPRTGRAAVRARADRPGLSGGLAPGGAWPLSASSGVVKFAVRACQFLVVGGVVLDAGELLVAELAPDLGRNAGHQRAGRDDGALQHHGTGGDEGPGADHGPVEDGGAHADQAVVLNGAAVDHGAVADADPRPDGAGEAGVGVQHHVVLQVAAGADGDGGGIGADTDTVEGARVLGQGGVADHGRRGRDEGGVMDGRSGTGECVEGSHASSLGHAAARRVSAVGARAP